MPVNCSACRSTPTAVTAPSARRHGDERHDRRGGDEAPEHQRQRPRMLDRQRPDDEAAAPQRHHRGLDEQPHREPGSSVAPPTPAITYRAAAPRATAWKPLTKLAPAVGSPAIAPAAAMPIAPPAWRAVLFIADARPARSPGTAPIAAATTAGVRMPMPTPQSRNAGSSVP